MSAPANFDRLAAIYRWMEWLTFGPALMRCRLCFLDSIAGCHNALILGDGDGRFTRQLLRASADMRVLAVDASPAMLRALARRAAPFTSRLSLHCADLRNWQPEGPAFDLVVTHFFLDCLTTAEVVSLASRLRNHLSPGARWVVSEFAVPHNRFGRWCAAPVVFALYTAFGWLTGLNLRRLPDHPAALARSGFTLVERRIFLGGLLAAEVWAAADSGPNLTPAAGVF